MNVYPLLSRCFLGHLLPVDRHGRALLFVVPVSLNVTFPSPRGKREGLLYYVVYAVAFHALPLGGLSLVSPSAVVISSLV